MKRLYQQPNDENVLSTFLENSIGRSAEVCKVVEALDTIEGPFSIAINGNWGAGKTFFIKQVKMVLDALSNLTEVCSENTEALTRRFWQLAPRNTVVSHTQVSVYYDAWMHDSDEDPVISLLYEMLQIFSDEELTSYREEYSSAFLKIVDLVTNRDISSGVEGIKDLLKPEADEAIRLVRKERNIQKEIREFLDSVKRERGDRIVIFIDELDRCSPEYSIKLLERIKHFFDCEDVSFVFATNLVELAHSVNSYYGASFNAGEYLNRFFDLIYPIPEENTKAYCRNYDFYDDGNALSSVMTAVLRHLNLSLREIPKYAEYYSELEAVSAKSQRGNGDWFCYVVLLPIMIALKSNNFLEYHEFVSGNRAKLLTGIVIDPNIALKPLATLLDEGEEYMFSMSNGKGKKVSLSDKLTKAYDAVFNTQYGDFVDGCTIGQCRFTAENKKKMLEFLNRIPL